MYIALIVLPAVVLPISITPAAAHDTEFDVLVCAAATLCVVTSINPLPTHISASFPLVEPVVPFAEYMTSYNVGQN